MSAPRASAGRILRTIATGARQTRQLHLTGSANQPIRVAASEKSPLGPPRDVAGLQPESQRSGFPGSEGKAEHTEHSFHRSSRPFSTSDSSYDLHSAGGVTSPTPDQLTIKSFPSASPFTPTNQSRQFNTSRELKAVGDNSTIDFAYLPVFPVPSLEEELDDIRVPVLPHISRNDGMKAPMASEVADIAANPTEVIVVSAESTHFAGGPSQMSESTDAPQDLDFQGLAKQLALGLERENGEETRKAKGLMKQVWTGFVDDLFGQKQQK